MESRLEREIRRLPHVLSCAITPTDIVVLVHPSADPAAVEREVMRILEGVGSEMRLKVLGETRPLDRRGRRRLAAYPVLIAAVAGVGAAVTIAVLLPGPPSRPPGALAPALELGPGAGSGATPAAGEIEETSAGPAAPPFLTPPSASTLGFSVRLLVPAPVPEVGVPQVAPSVEPSVPPAAPPAQPPELPSEPPAPPSQPLPSVEVVAPALPPGSSEQGRAPESPELEAQEGDCLHVPIHRHPPVPGPHRHPPIPVGNPDLQACVGVSAETGPSEPVGAAQQGPQAGGPPADALPSPAAAGAENAHAEGAGPANAHSEAGAENAHSGGASNGGHGAGH